MWAQGIENKIEPDAPISGNAYDKQFAPERKLPGTLGEAARRLKQSTAARKLFGDEFVDHYAATRISESAAFQKHITDWELERYFEII